MMAPYGDRIENYIPAGRVYTEFKTCCNNSQAVARRWQWVISVIVTALSQSHGRLQVL